MTQRVVGGVDTHGLTHHAAVIDAVLGRQLGDREFPATAAGYRALAAWLAGFGEVAAVGMEGTGAYGAGLARHLAEVGFAVVEVDRPDRRLRRAKGKTDPGDAYAAAAAVASGRATGSPKSRTGAVEAIRMLRVARSSAVKARTQAMNQIRMLLVTVPAPLREQVDGLPKAALIRTLARLRPAADLQMPLNAAKFSLRGLARRYQLLDVEIDGLDAQIAPLVAATAPVLLELFGVGPEVAGQLLITAGDNPERMRSQAAFARLAGAAPLPASSGRTQRHRLSRGGDRQANHALHRIALVRMRYHEPTRAYVARRTSEGLSKMEILRCLKRFIAREVFRALMTLPLGQTPHTEPQTDAA
jgi:transposase